MEQRTSFTIIVIRIINVFNSYIIFTNSKVRNTNSNCWVVFSIKCCSIYFSAIYFNNSSTTSICNRNRHSDGLIFKISYVSRNNCYTRSNRINMEQCTSISIVIVRIVMIVGCNIVFAYNKTRNSECSFAIRINRFSKIHISTINCYCYFTGSICNRNSHSNGLIIVISNVSRNNSYR